MFPGLGILSAIAYIKTEKNERGDKGRQMGSKRGKTRQAPDKLEKSWQE